MGEFTTLDKATLALATEQLGQSDERLRTLIAQVGPCGLAPGRQPGHLTALIRSIVFQQLSAKAASTIFARVQSCVGPEACEEPSAARWLLVPDEQLRACGLSRQKISYLRDLCQKVHAGQLDMQQLGRMGDEQIVQALIQVKGFGRWSAHMYLLFHLGRADVWPLDDLGIRKGLMRLDGLAQLPKPAEVQGRAESWRPFRSVASWYLWRLLEVAPEQMGW